jgi:hypothetical protein
MAKRRASWGTVLGKALQRLLWMAGLVGIVSIGEDLAYWNKMLRDIYDYLALTISVPQWLLQVLILIFHTYREFLDRILFFLPDFSRELVFILSILLGRFVYVATHRPWVALWLSDKLSKHTLRRVSATLSALEADRRAMIRLLEALSTQDIVIIPKISTIFPYFQSLGFESSEDGIFVSKGDKEKIELLQDHIGQESVQVKAAALRSFARKKSFVLNKWKDAYPISSYVGGFAIPYYRYLIFVGALIFIISYNFIVFSPEVMRTMLSTGQLNLEYASMMLENQENYEYYRIWILVYMGPFVLGLAISFFLWLTGNLRQGGTFVLFVLAIAASAVFVAVDKAGWHEMRTGAIVGGDMLFCSFLVWVYRREFDLRSR